RGRRRPDDRGRHEGLLADVHHDRRRPEQRHPLAGHVHLPGGPARPPLRQRRGRLRGRLPDHPRPDGRLPARVPRPGGDRLLRPSIALRRTFDQAVRLAILLALAAVTIFPLAWMVSGSLKPLEQVFTIPVQWIPNPVQPLNYPSAITFTGFARPLL